jgi:hypothetical protein
MNLTAEEGLALTNLLERAIADDHYRLSPRVQTWQHIVDKLQPQAALPAVSQAIRRGPAQTAVVTTGSE